MQSDLKYLFPLLRYTRFKIVILSPLLSNVVPDSKVHYVGLSVGRSVGLSVCRSVITLFFLRARDLWLLALLLNIIG